MVGIAKNVPVDLPTLPVRATADRLVCKPSQSPNSSVHLTVSGLRRLGNRCTDMPMAKTDGNVRLSSNNNNGTDVTEDQTRETRKVDSNRTELANDYLVHNSDNNVFEQSANSSQRSLTGSASQQPSTPKPIINFFGNVGDQLPKLIKEGYSEEVLNHLSLARTESTNLTYQSKWKLFAQFANDRGFDPFYGSPALVADFLLFVAKTRNATFSTIAGYRAAIGRVLRLTTGYDPGKCQILAQLFQSFKRTQPVNASRIPCWNISYVLETLGDGQFANSLLSDKMLTAKAIFLTALASGDRRSALAALSFSSMDLTENDLTIGYDPKFVPKSYFVRKNLTKIKPLTIPKINGSDSNAVCPVRTIVDYIGMSNRYRTENQTSLFISHVHNKDKNITPQSIAFYITLLIKWCYEQSNIVLPGCRSHDVRKIAASLRALSVGSLGDVLESGNWAQPMTFIKHYFIQFSDTEQAALSHFPEIIAGRMSNKFSSVRRRKKRDSNTKPPYQSADKKHDGGQKAGI